jgi:ankyrin repeat protein
MAAESSDDSPLPAPERAAAMIRVACSRDVRRAREMLDARPELSTFDFYAACATGEAEVVEEAIKRESGLANRVGGPLGWAPILYAGFSRLLRADARRADGIVRVVRVLLDRGADPNAQYFEGSGEARHAQTALFGAAGVANNAALTRMLLEAGADVDEGLGEPSLETWTGLGTEALYHASEFEDVACLRLLLEARPHPLRVSYCLARALDFAAPAAALLYLEHGADPNFRVPWQHDRTHLHKAVINGRDVAVVERMIGAGADVNAADAIGATPLRYAVRNGDPRLAEVLERHGASRDAVTETDRRVGACVLGEAVGPVGTAEAAEVLCRAAMRGEVDVVRRLLDAGADADAGGGMPVLHQACWHGQAEAARVLVEHGASLSAVNRYGGDALGAAIHGSVNCCDPEGGPGMRPPEEIRHGRYGEVVGMLIDAGARVPGHIGEASEEVWGVLKGRGHLVER